MSEPSCQDLKVLEIVPFGQSKGEGCFFTLRLEPPQWEAWRPGQFVMVRPEAYGEELVWGRPLSICWMDSRDLTLFFQVVGRGTLRLAQLRRGDVVTVWGPLGNGFVVDEEAPTLMLAGGMGIVPFVGYALEHPRPESLRLFFGHRLPVKCYPYGSVSALVTAERFRETEPGDLDRFKAMLRERMQEYAEKGLILACGPQPFLRTVQAISGELGARTHISLENRMGCGVGACLGCVTKKKSGHPVQVCTAGPVFLADAVVLEDEP